MLLKICRCVLTTIHFTRSRTHIQRNITQRSKFCSSHKTKHNRYRLRDTHLVLSIVKKNSTWCWAARTMNKAVWMQYYLVRCQCVFIRPSGCQFRSLVQSLMSSFYKRNDKRFSQASLHVKLVISETQVVSMNGKRKWWVIRSIEDNNRICHIKRNGQERINKKWAVVMMFIQFVVSIKSFKRFSSTYDSFKKNIPFL